jgi:arylsulfatase A-like enzyme
MMATHNIHVPRVPNPRFKGKSDCGVRGDAIVEFDWTAGQVLDQLEKLGLAANTLVILSSDNGGINDDNGPDKVHGCGDPDATNGHLPNGVLRGTKGTFWEGGTRVPCLVRWPGKVQPGTSDVLLSQVDFLASLAALTGQQIPAGHAPDSQNHLPALLGAAKEGREFLLEQGNTGAPFGLRFGTWKLTPNAGPKAGPGKALYNLADDLGETRNVAAEHPDIVAKMTAALQDITGLAPGAAQPAKRKNK